MSISVFLFGAVAAGMLTSCSTVSKGIVADPEVHVHGMTIEDLNFDQATLALDLNVYNPNRIAATLAGFDYSVKIDGSEFVRGEQDRPVRVGPLTSTVVRVPFTLKFSDVFRTLSALQNKERFQYEVECGLKFSLPVLGPRRLPICKSGMLPVVKPPTIELRSLALSRSGMIDQQLLLTVNVRNPNTFGVTINTLSYDLVLNGRPSAQGRTTKLIDVKPASESDITLPVSLDLLSAGAALADTLTSGKSLTYALRGSAEVVTTLPEFSRVTLPFHRTGTISLQR
ncbi:MAG: LEA type 2 family protein [bacterium]|nr:LEA type 2 family protein [bacterium]